MSMDTQTKELVQLWNLLDLGLDLNGRYADTGIINEGDEGVEPIEPRQADWFEAAGIVGVASLVNAYMEDPTSYQRGAVNSLVKLIGDKLLQTFEGKRVKIEF